MDRAALPTSAAASVDGLPVPEDDGIDAHVGGRIRAARLMAGMGQPKLAAGMKVSAQQLQKYERGHNRISVSKLILAARTLQIPVGYFWEGLENRVEERSAVRTSTHEDVVALLEQPGARDFLLNLLRLDPTARAQVASVVRAMVRTAPGDGAASEADAGEEERAA